MQDSVKCARSILSLIKNGINLISNQYDYHEFIVKLSIDEGGECNCTLWTGQKFFDPKTCFALTVNNDVVTIYVCLHAFRVCIE